MKTTARPFAPFPFFVLSPPAPPIKVAAGDILRFNLVFLPEHPGEHSFHLPLLLEGIPQDGARHLRVPVIAVGLKPTLMFMNNEVDFGQRVVSRDPCSLKQHQGEFVLKNISDKASGIDQRGRSFCCCCCSN